MAVGVSQTLADALLAAADDYTWIKLHVGDPGAAGATNPAGNTTRQQLTWTAAGAGPSANTRGKSNTAAVSWTGVSTAEDYTHFSAWDASTAGNFGFSGTITANAVLVGDTFTIPTGDLDISFPVAS